MKKVIGVLLVAIAVALVVQGVGWGSLYDYVNLQGRLTNSSTGNAIPAGTYNSQIHVYRGPDTSTLTLVSTGAAYTDLHPLTVNSSGMFSYDIPTGYLAGYSGLDTLWLRIYVQIDGSMKDFGVQRVTTVPFALRAAYADNVLAGGITLPYAGAKNVAGSTFSIINTNSSSSSAVAITGVKEGTGGGAAVWGIAGGAKKGIGVLGQSLADASFYGKPWQCIGVYGASDGVGVFGGGPTIAWNQTTGSYSVEAANIGVGAMGKQYGVYSYSTGGFAFYGYGGYMGAAVAAPYLGTLSIAGAPTGGIGVMGSAMANWDPATPNLKRSIGVYGGSDYIGVFGGGSQSWSGTSDIVTLEGANIGVAGAGGVYGVAGYSGLNTGVAGVGKKIGVGGLGPVGVTGVGINDGGIGVVGYHKDNPSAAGSLGSFWMSGSNKIAAAVSGVYFTSVLPPAIMTQGALATYYGTGQLAGVYGRVEDGRDGAGVVGHGGDSSYAGRFSTAGTKPAIYVENTYAGNLYSAAHFNGEVRVLGWGQSSINFGGSHSNYLTHSSTGTSQTRIRTFSGSAYTTVFNINQDGELSLLYSALPTGSGNTMIIASDGKVGKITSSRRYKDNIQPLNDNFSNVLKLEPKSFNWKSNGKADIGLIAEEVDEAGLKNLVMYNDQGQPDAVKYEKVALYLLQVVKEQQARIKALEDKVR